MDKNEFSNGEQYFFEPGERVEVTAEELATQRMTPQLVRELIERLYKDKVDLRYFIQAYQLILDNYITVRGTRRVPLDTGRQLIIKLYDTIEPYRSLLLGTNDHGPYPSREVYDLRCAMVDIIRMYDEYCAGIRDLIVPPMPQQATTTLAPATPPTAMPTEIATPDKPVTGNDPAPDLEELGQYFKGPYRGYGGLRDYFTEIIDDTMKLSTAKEVGMVAHLLFGNDIAVGPAFIERGVS